MVELIFLLSLLAALRMRSEHIRKMSKNADNEHSLEELSTLHPCFIDIFAVIYCCLLFEKDVLTLSQGVSVCQASFPLSTRHLTIDRLMRQLASCFQAAPYYFRMRGIYLDKSHNQNLKASSR